MSRRQSACAIAVASILLVLGLEISVGLIIRDDLTLNILTLIHPFEVIKRWQMAA